MSAPGPKQHYTPWRGRGTALPSALLFVVIAAFSGIPRASNAAPGAAEVLALFNEGVRLRKEGKMAEACAMFAESYRLSPMAGALLSMADCHEQEGKLATAWAEFLSASRLYQARDSERGVAECRRRAALLEPRLSRLTLRVERPMSGLVIKRDDHIVEAAQFGLPLPVDPGEYVITAEAPGHVPFRTTAVVDAQRRDVAATVPALVAQPASKPAASRPLAGYVVGGLGIVTLGVGATFGVMAALNNAKAEDACPSSVDCERDKAVDAHDRAAAQARVANVSVGLGLVGLGAGGYMLFFAPPSPKAGSSVSPRGVAVYPQPGGLGVAIRF